MVVEQAEQTLAAFLLDDGSRAKGLLASIEQIDAIDTNVQIVDAAVVDRTKRGRIKVHQTTDRGALKSGARAGTIGVVVGAIVLGPAGAVVGGAAGSALGALRGRIHDTGIDDKFIKEVSAEIEKGKSALFVLYEGNWSGTIGAVGEAIKEHNAMLFHSTLPADKARALQELVVPAIEELGGEEAVSDYEVEVEETVTAEEAAAAEAADTAAVEEAPAEAQAPVAESPVAEAAAVAAAGVAVGPGAADDLTQLAGIGPKAAAALNAAGITTYAALAQANEPQLRHALYQGDMIPPGSVSSWPMQADYAARGDWQGLMKRNAKSKSTAKASAAAGAAAATTAPAEPAAAPDDLTQISGIGPRLSSILSHGGVTTYAQLEQMSPDELREIIALGGALPPASLSSWPAQASYAVRGDWAGLASYNRSR
jgi:predicted flap endonuclease-1-like 5' DNA nuclease/uncharacterized membrane protein